MRHSAFGNLKGAIRGLGIKPKDRVSFKTKTAGDPEKTVTGVFKEIADYPGVQGIALMSGEFCSFRIVNIDTIRKL